MPRRVFRVITSDAVTTNAPGPGPRRAMAPSMWLTGRDPTDSDTPAPSATIESALDLLDRFGPVILMAEISDTADGASPVVQAPAPPTFARVTTWDVRTARTLAVEYAERVLPWLSWFEPDDDRPARVVTTARAIVDGHTPAGALRRARADASAYVLEVGDPACHPVVLPAARACAATVLESAWESVVHAARAAAVAEANGAAWDAAWAAARDAAWFACTAAATDDASAAAWHETWASAFDRARRWQAARLEHHLRIAQGTTCGER